ncbi:MAG TPA: hypothetical protein VGH37_10455 [Candidatus Acidoferrum sp.]
MNKREEILSKIQDTRAALAKVDAQLKTATDLKLVEELTMSRRILRRMIRREEQFSTCF